MDFCAICAHKNDDRELLVTDVVEVSTSFTCEDDWLTFSKKGGRRDDSCEDSSGTKQIVDPCNTDCRRN